MLRDSPLLDPLGARCLSQLTPFNLPSGVVDITGLNLVSFVTVIFNQYSWFQWLQLVSVAIADLTLVSVTATSFIRYYSEVD